MPYPITRGRMAQVLPIFQPLEIGHCHVDRLTALLVEPWITDVVISSAYANAAGVNAVTAVLEPIGERCRAFIGVRNGSTTAQSLAALLKLKVELYGVDTAMRGRIFHSKLYVAIGVDRARAIIGSANLTHAGLHNNLETGAEIVLDFADEMDKAFLEYFVNGLQRLIDEFPEHCFRITSKRQIIDLMRQGLLEDERDPKIETVLGTGRQGTKTAKARIPLPFTPPPKNRRARKPRPPIPTPGTTLSIVPHYGQLVWAKPGLPSGDLQLLKEGHTSGVLRLTQAGYEVAGKRIDQTTYFRNEVFSQLVWASDIATGKETAVAPISLIIAGVYVGDFDLRLSHKDSWEAGQGNYTTGLHWHDATNHIRKPGLIGRTLRLFEPSATSGRYVIEID